MRGFVFVPEILYMGRTNFESDFSKEIDKFGIWHKYD